MITTQSQHAPTAPGAGWLARLNSTYHELGLKVFMVIVLAHWAEHLVQAVQIFGLGWPRPEARGVLGQFFPWLVKSETLHYGYAIVMLVGLLLLLPGFTGRSRRWWLVAIAIQFWHHVEHLLLQLQAAFHHNLFGSPVPISIAQLVVPRVELHLIYNTLVFVPMVVALYYHMVPPAAERAQPAGCTCRRAGATSR